MDKNNRKENVLSSEIVSKDGPQNEYRSSRFSIGFYVLLPVAGLVMLVLGRKQLFDKILLHLDKKYLTVLCPSFIKREALLKWASNRLPPTWSSHSTKTLSGGMKELWTDGSLLCTLINTAVPGACPNPHRHWKQPPVHAQALAYKYFGVTPIFTNEDLKKKLSVTLERKFVGYFAEIQQSINKIYENSEKHNKISDRYIIRGMGLFSGEQFKTTVFYIYLDEKNDDDNESNIIIQIKGPFGSFGEAVSPRLINKNRKFRRKVKTERRSSIKLIENLQNLQSNINNLSWHFSRSQKKKEYEEIDVEATLENGRIKVCYVPKNYGMYEINMIAGGEVLKGCPFNVHIFVNENGDNESMKKLRQLKTIRKVRGTTSDNASIKLREQDIIYEENHTPTRSTFNFKEVVNEITKNGTVFKNILGTDKENESTNSEININNNNEEAKTQTYSNRFNSHKPDEIIHYLPDISHTHTNDTNISPISLKLSSDNQSLINDYTPETPCSNIKIDNEEIKSDILHNQTSELLEDIKSEIECGNQQIKSNKINISNKEIVQENMVIIKKTSSSIFKETLTTDKDILEIKDTNTRIFSKNINTEKSLKNVNNGSTINEANNSNDNRELINISNENNVKISNIKEKLEFDINNFRQNVTQSTENNKETDNKSKQVIKENTNKVFIKPTEDVHTVNKNRNILSKNDTFIKSTEDIISNYHTNKIAANGNNTNINTNVKINKTAMQSANKSSWNEKADNKIKSSDKEETSNKPDRILVENLSCNSNANKTILNKHISDGVNNFKVSVAPESIFTQNEVIAIEKQQLDHKNISYKFEPKYVDVSTNNINKIKIPERFIDTPKKNVTSRLDDKYFKNILNESKVTGQPIKNYNLDLQKNIDINNYEINNNNTEEEYDNQSQISDDNDFVYINIKGRVEKYREKFETNTKKYTSPICRDHIEPEVENFQKTVAERRKIFAQSSLESEPNSKNSSFSDNESSLGSNRKFQIEELIVLNDLKNASHSPRDSWSLCSTVSLPNLSLESEFSSISSVKDKRTFWENVSSRSSSSVSTKSLSPKKLNRALSELERSKLIWKKPEEYILENTCTKKETVFPNENTRKSADDILSIVENTPHQNFKKYQSVDESLDKCTVLTIEERKKMLLKQTYEEEKMNKKLITQKKSIIKTETTKDVSEIKDVTHKDECRFSPISERIKKFKSVLHLSSDKPDKINNDVPKTIRKVKSFHESPILKNKKDPEISDSVKYHQFKKAITYFKNLETQSQSTKPTPVKQKTSQESRGQSIRYRSSSLNLSNISEKYSIENLYEDVFVRNKGSFKGTPNRSAVVDALATFSRNPNNFEKNGDNEDSIKYEIFKHVKRRNRKSLKSVFDVYY